MSTSDIDNVKGLANGAAVGAGFTAEDSPFGGLVVISGHVANPPDVVGGGSTPLEYRVSVSDDGGSTWQPLNNKFGIHLTELVDGVWSGPTPYTQTTNNGWYKYKEDLTGPPGTGNPMRFVSQNVLAKWQTGGLNGIWRIKIDAKDPVSNTIYYGTQIINVKLDNQAPTADITITSGGGACADFEIGETISGDYSAWDTHMGSIHIYAEPNMGGTNFTSPVPLPRTYPALPTAGESGTWSLDTSMMPRCGYVIRLVAHDRTIVNSGSKGLRDVAVVGLCLREKAKK